MKAWHFLIPLLAMTSMGVVFEKRERDATAAELKTARDSLAASGPILARGAPRAPAARAALTVTAMQDAYQRAFEGERRDAPWADSAEEQAARELKSLAPAASTVRAVECRTSMCRFETAHANQAAYEAFVRSVFIGPSKALWNAPQFSTVLEQRADGSLRVASYLAREGRALPALD